MSEESLANSQLLQAIESHNLPLMRQAFASGAEVGWKNAKGDTILHVLVRCNFTAGVAYMLHHYADEMTIDAPNDNKDTPLLLAFEYGKREIVDLLLAAGADPTCENKKQQTILFKAVANRDDVGSELTSIALDLGANPNVFNSAGYTPLYYPVELGTRIATLKKLLRAGADPYKRSDMVINTPHDIAQAEGHNAHAELLEAYMSLPEFDPERPAEDYEWDSVDAHLLRSPVFWREHAAELFSQGGPLPSRSALTKAGWSEDSAMASAVYCNRFDLVQKVLAAQGEAITPEDFWTHYPEDGAEPKMSSFAQAVVEHPSRTIQQLLSEEAWADKTSTQLTTYYAKLPEEVQQATEGYHRLHHTLRGKECHERGITGRA